MYTNIRVDGQAQAREGRGLRQRCKFVVPSLLQFFWVEKFVSKNQQFLPVWLRKNELDKLKKKSRSFSGRTFFWVKGGRGIQGQEKDRGRDRERRNGKCAQVDQH